MPNFIERWLLRRTNSNAPEARTTFGSEATRELLQILIPYCSACQRSLDGHSYRFFACHPAIPAPDAAMFLHAIETEDWPAVQASQKPAIDQPLLVLYAITCPHPPQDCGMVALLLTQPDLRTPDALVKTSALNPEGMAALRAQCPACQWISLSAPLLSTQHLD